MIIGNCDVNGRVLFKKWDFHSKQPTMTILLLDNDDSDNEGDDDNDDVMMIVM